MLHEKPNESFHWKNKLDELDHLPGEAVTHKTASWKKLHDRLGNKPRYKKALWYWLAAACILVAIGLWTITNQKEDKIVVGKNQLIPEQSVNKPEIVRKGSPVVNPTVITLKKEERQVPGTSIKIKSHHVAKNASVIIKHIDKDAVTTKELLPEAIVQTVNVVDTISTKAIVSAPLKNKLRVVHINDLEKPADKKTQYAKTTFLAKDLNQDGVSAFSLSKNASDNIVKIKLSPSN